MTNPDELFIVATDVLVLSYVIVPALILVAAIEKEMSVTFLDRLSGTPVNVTFPREIVNMVVNDVGA